MKQTRNPIRLLVEILVIMAVAQAAVMIALPVVAPGLAARNQGFLSAALLVLLAGPTIYWRCMAMTRQPSAGSRGKEGPRGSTVNAAIAMIAAAQALGLVLTGLCVVWQQRTISEVAQAKFERSAERIETEAQRHFGLPLYALNGLRGLFAGDAHVTRSRFRAWVESQNLPAEFPGVRGL